MPLATNGPKAELRPSHVTFTIGDVSVNVRTITLLASRISSVQSLKFASVIVVLNVVVVEAVDVVPGANNGLFAVSGGNDGEVLSTNTLIESVTWAYP